MEQTGKVIWQMEKQPPDFSALYTKKQQLKNREQAMLNRQTTTDSKAKRKADNRRKIIIGGIWLKYFPECKQLDPSSEDNFNGVVSAIAALANNPKFLSLWMEAQKKIKNRPVGSPTGPVES